MPNRLRKFLCCTLAWLVLAGCRDEQAPAPAPLLSVSSPPVDRLAPGEIAEGSADAFGLKLPRMMRVRFRGPDKVEAEGHVEAELVANYVRKRTKAASVELGAARTVFEQVKVNGDAAGRSLRVEVVALGGKTQLIVKDLTPPRFDPSLTPEDRWKKHGFDKDGKLIDPNTTM